VRQQVDQLILTQDYVCRRDGRGTSRYDGAENYAFEEPAHTVTLLAFPAASIHPLSDPPPKRIRKQGVELVASDPAKPILLAAECVLLLAERILLLAKLVLLPAKRILLPPQRILLPAIFRLFARPRVRLESAEPCLLRAQLGLLRAQRGLARSELRLA